MHFWLVTFPLNSINKSRDAKALNLINYLVRNNKKVLIYSDYPTNQKLKVLGIKGVDELYPKENSFLMLKPNSIILEKWFKKHNVNEKRIVYFGDDSDKDGIIAKKLSINYFNLSAFKHLRNKQWRNILK